MVVVWVEEEKLNFMKEYHENFQSATDHLRIIAWFKIIPIQMVNIFKNIKKLDLMYFSSEF